MIAIPKSSLYSKYSSLNHWRCSLDPLTETQQLVAQAKSLASRRNFNAAIDLITQAIQLDHNNAELYNDRHIFLAILKRYDAAMADLEQAIELDANNATYYYNRAQLRKKMKQFDAALADYNQAIQLKSDYAHALYMRAQLYLVNFQKDQEALDDLERVLQITPDDDDAYWMRANIWHQKWEYALAIEDLNKAIAVNPKNPLYYQLRGSIHSLGEHQKALEDYNRGLALAPRFVGLLVQRGYLHTIMGDFDAALIDFEKAHKIAPDFEPAKHGIAAAKAKKPAHFIF